MYRRILSRERKGNVLQFSVVSGAVLAWRMSAGDQNRHKGVEIKKGQSKTQKMFFAKLTLANPDYANDRQSVI